MVFYFSGTGNSRWAAENIAGQLGEQAVSIPAVMNGDVKTAPIGPEESVGIVFPVYAWNPPEMVVRFARRLRVRQPEGSFVWALATCGDDAGNSLRVLEKCLPEGLRLASGWAVLMPNNYIVMFDVDPPRLQEKKLAAAGEKLEEIAAQVAQRKEGVFERREGGVPGLKTTFVGSTFNQFARRTGPFCTTEECISCGLCQRICPVKTIHLADGKPVWGKACTMCLGCLHRCPTAAIQYGKKTKAKGRYVNPYIQAQQEEQGWD